MHLWDFFDDGKSGLEVGPQCHYSGLQLWAEQELSEANIKEPQGSCNSQQTPAGCFKTTLILGPCK